jgi:alpha-galactosidase
MLEPISVQADDGELTVGDGSGKPLLVARAEVLLGDGSSLTTPHPSLSWSIDTPGADDTRVIRLRFRNEASEPVALEQLRPLVSVDGFRSVPLDALRILQCGWQSWSRSHPSAPFEPNLTSAGPPIRGPYLPHRRADSQAEAWMTVLSTADPLPSGLLLGFVSARDQLGTLEIAPESGGRHSLRAATEVDGTLLQPGAEIASEPLLLALGPEHELLDLYASHTGQHMQARAQSSVLSGWCSWYQLYTSVSEADVDRNLASLAAQRDRVPLGLIQLDDGYQRAVGDWLELNDKFPSGMPALVERIQRHGYMPGVWLAPFLLSERSHTYVAHPDWVVRDDNGAPVNALTNWGAPNYALDTTHPQALEWLAQVVETVTREWGFDYLKLDFLYAGAVRGRRHDPLITAVQAYRRGLELLRETAGERFILGCGAPLVPSIGLVDGMRIGSDVAAYWGEEGNSDGPSLRNATRATLGRLWMHGAWWTNDPDCVVVRASDTELCVDEVQAWLGVVALSGGMLFVGDDVSRVEPERLEMLSRLIPPSGVAATALPPLVNAIPERLIAHFGEHHVLGVANWSDAHVQAALDVSELHLAHAAYHVVDLWTGVYLGRVSDQLALGALAPHAMRLLSLRAVNGERPVVVGSTGHLLGAAMDVTAEEWDAETGTLVIHLREGAPPARRGEVLIAESVGAVRRVPLPPPGATSLSVGFA